MNKTTIQIADITAEIAPNIHVPGAFVLKARSRSLSKTQAVKTAAQLLDIEIADAPVLKGAINGIAAIEGLPSGLASYYADLGQAAENEAKAAQEEAIEQAQAKVALGIPLDAPSA